MDTDTETLQRLLKAKEDALSELKLSFEEFKEEANEYERELEADNEHKEKEIESLHKKLETATKKMEDYKKEISQSNRIMEREKGKIDTLSEELSTLKTRIVQLEQVNEELERDIRNVKFEKQELMEKLEGLEERFVIEREDLEEQLKQKNDDLERFRQDVHEYEDELVLWKRKSLHKSVRSGPGSMIDVGEQSDAEKIAHLQEEITKYRDELERLSDQLGDKNRDIIGYTCKIADIEAEMDQLRESLEQKEKEVEEKEKDLVETQNENATLKQQLVEKDNCISELNVKVEVELTKNKEFQEQINQLAVQHTKQNSAVVEEPGCIAIEEDRESQKTGEDSRIKEDTERLLLDVQEKEDLINHLNTELDEVKNSLEEEKTRKCQLENLINGLSAELEEERAITNELRREIQDKSRQTHGEIYSEISGYNDENRSPMRSPMRSPSYVENTSPSVYARDEEDEVEEQSDAGRSTVVERKAENMEEMVNRMQEENIKLTEKYQRLVDVIGCLEKTVSDIKDDKTKLEMDLHGRDQKIAMLERMYEELQRELQAAKENQDPNLGSYKSEKIPKLAIPDAYRSDLDTMPTEHYQSSTNRNGATLFNNVNGIANGKNLYSKNLYIKPSQAGLPSYIKIQDKCVLLGDQNEAETISKSYALDGIFNDVQDINLQETLGRPLSETLGKNLMVLIYGNKNTDKKMIRYQILQDFIKLFRAMSMKEKFQDKICKVSIKLEDPIALAKMQRLRSTANLVGVNTFTIGNIESEQELYEYCKAIKDIYNTKDKKNSSPSKVKSALKQIILELSVELPRKDIRFKPQNFQTVQKTRVVIASINSQIQEECGSPLSLFARKCTSNQDDSVDRFIFLAVNPAASSESYSSTANVLSFADKLEKASEIDQDFTTPVHQLETSSTGFSPENRISEEKTYVPRKIKKSTLVADPNDDEGTFSMNPDASMYSSTSYRNRDDLPKKSRGQSNKGNFLQDNMSKLFGFMKKLKSSKKQRSQSKSSFTDPKMSVLSTKSAAPNSGIVRKLVVQLE